MGWADLSFSQIPIYLDWRKRSVNMGVVILKLYSVNYLDNAAVQGGSFFESLLQRTCGGVS